MNPHLFTSAIWGLAPNKALDMQHGPRTLNGKPHGAFTDALLRSLRDAANTDSGGEAHNQALSQRRAASVLATVLSKRPCLKGCLEVPGRGERELLSPSIKPRGHVPNRRVEIRP